MNKVVVVFLILVMLGCSSSTNTTNTTINETVEDNTTIFDDPMYLKAEEFTNECYRKDKLGNNNYEAANDNYDIDNWDGVVYKCKIAREYYSDAIMECSKAYGYYNIIEAEGDELLYLKYKTMLSEIVISEVSNMYEVCENFEQASKYYKLNDYNAAGDYMDVVKEKILGHDSDVERYRLLYGKIVALEDKILS